MPSLQTPATWHWAGGLHVKGTPTQAPPTHWSPLVQAMPSAHGEASARTGKSHCPVCVLQLPAPRHTAGFPHTTALPLLHVPSWQVSVCVHALPSVHGSLLGRAGLEQTPEPASQVPAAWH